MLNFSNIVLTGGISAFNPKNIFRKYFVDFLKNKKSFEINQIENIFNQTLQKNKLSDQVICEIINLNAENISAEFSMLNWLKKNGMLAEPFNVSIIFTDTPDGKMAALLNKKIIEVAFKDVTKVNLKMVDFVDVSNREKMTLAMGNFMEIVANELWNGIPQTTFFAPVGGYKLFTYLGYAAASFFGYPSGYMYEESQELILIPPVPISIDLDIIAKHIELIKRLMFQKGCLYDELNSEEREFVDNNPFFFEKQIVDGQTLVDINTFIHFVLKDYLTTQIMVTSSVLKTIEKYTSQKGFIDNQIITMLKKLNDYYENNNQALKGEVNHNEDWGFKAPKVYKGASNGKLIFRAAYDYERQQKCVYIYKIWLAHEEYQRECDEIKKGRLNIHEEKENMIDYKS